MKKNPIITLGLTLCLGVTLTACQNAKTHRQAVVLETKPLGSSVPNRTRPVVELITPVGGMIDGYAATTLLARQRLGAERQGPERLGVDVIDEGFSDARPISLAFRELDAKDALRILIGELLKRDFVIAQDVTGQVTLEVDAELTTQDLYDLLDALSVVYNWSIEDRAGTYVVRAGKNRTGTSLAPILTARSANPSEQPAIRIFPVKYISPQEAAEVFKPLLSVGGMSMVAGRLIVVADTIAQLNRLGELLRSLDSPSFEGVSIWTYELTFQPPQEAARVLTAIARASGLSVGGEAMTTFIEIPHSKMLMVIAQDSSLQPMLRDWVERVDQRPDMAERYDYVYHIQNYEPHELQTLLTSFYQGRLEKDANDPVDNRMRLIVSAVEDLLLIRATPSDYADLMALLEKVDRSRQQVHIQAIIAEVTLSDSLEYGVEYFLTTETGSGLLDLTGALTQFAPANPAGTAVFLATDGFAIINALKTMSNVSVLSAPSTFVRDKDEALLQVGAQVPIISAAIDSSTQVGGTSGVRNEIKYQDTGIILAVSPKINESGEVTMTIRLEVTDAVPTTSSGIDSPTFTTRIAETVVTVPNNMTVLIGGAIQHRTTDRTGSIPFLGDIPGIGLAFQSKEKTIDRTELLLMITPTIVNNPADTSLIVSDFIRGAHSLRKALQNFDAPIAGALHEILVDSIDNRSSAPPIRAPAAPNKKRDARKQSPIKLGLNTLAANMQSAPNEQAEEVALFFKMLAATLPDPDEG